MYHSTEYLENQITSLRAELASRQIDVDTFREGNQKLRAELADMKRADWKVAHIKDLEAQLTERRDRVDDLDKELAAKDARIKEEFDKYCRNLTELAQVHKETCDAKDARIAELEAQLADMKAAADEEFNNCSREEARADRAEARVAELEGAIEINKVAVKNLRARAEGAELELTARIANPDIPAKLSNAIARAEAKLAAVDQQREDFFWDKQRAEAERDAAMSVVRWVETWVGQPVGAYSVYALDGLFGMTRDKIAALAPSPTVGGTEE